MLLNGRERLLLLNAVLPPEGDLLTMKLVHDVREQLGLSESDLKDLGVTSPSQQISFDALEKLTEKEIEIGTVLAGIVATALTELSTKKKLTPQHVSLCEKFGVTGGT
jgi:hypothetical protein